MQAEYPQKIFPLWPKKIQAKGNVHEKKLMWFENCPSTLPNLIIILMVRPLSTVIDHSSRPITTKNRSVTAKSFLPTR